MPNTYPYSYTIKPKVNKLTYPARYTWLQAFSKPGRIVATNIPLTNPENTIITILSEKEILDELKEATLLKDATIDTYVHEGLDAQLDVLQVVRNHARW